jgi:phenylalanyl-tRNA synthetase beta chain
VAVGVVDTNPNEPPPARVAFRPVRVDHLLGTSIPADEQTALLARVGIVAEAAPPDTPVVVAAGAQPLTVDAGSDAVLVATIPSWRRDLAIEADVTEEVARVHGYERVPEILPHTPMPAYRHPPLRLRDHVRSVLVGAGLTEAVTFALVSPEQVERFGPLSDVTVPGEGEPGGAPIVVTNPLSSQHSIMRQSLVGSLLDVVATNTRHGREDVAIFEVGKGYGTLPDGAGTHEWWRLGLALTGAAEIPSWDRPARPFDLEDAKGLIELIAHSLGLPAVSYEPITDDPNLHPGRAARATSGDRLAARVGELHPSLIETAGVRSGRVIVAEVAIAGLSGGEPLVPRGATPSRHPVVERDLAVVVPDDRPAAAVAAAIARHAGELLTDLRLFDIYRGRPLADGEKSLAYRLTFAADRTLTEAEVDAAIAAVSAGTAADLGAHIRT